MTSRIRTMLYDFLHYTQEPDESSASRIEAEGESGMKLLRSLCSPNLTFTPGSESGQLLCEYVLRCEAGAAAAFQEDFKSDIIRLQSIYLVEGYAEAMGYDS